MEATVAYEDNTPSRIIHLVEVAQEEKTNTQQLIDRFGDRYRPAVLAASMALLIIPPLFGADFAEWARRAVALTVAGAPCALVMSTPVAVAAAIGSAGKRGLLIKGGVHLENLGRVQVVAFDKTVRLSQSGMTGTVPTPISRRVTGRGTSIPAACTRFPAAREMPPTGERRLGTLVWHRSYHQPGLRQWAPVRHQHGSSVSESAFPIRRKPRRNLGFL